MSDSQNLNPPNKISLERKRFSLKKDALLCMQNAASLDWALFLLRGITQKTPQLSGVMKTSQQVLEIKLDEELKTIYEKLKELYDPTPKEENRG